MEKYNFKNLKISLNNERKTNFNKDTYFRTFQAKIKKSALSYVIPTSFTITVFS